MIEDREAAKDLSLQVRIADAVRAGNAKAKDYNKWLKSKQKRINRLTGAEEQEKKSGRKTALLFRKMKKW